MSQIDFTALRNRMVDEQLRGRDITDPRVLDAMREVPRHLFVPEQYRHMAYQDTPLPIGHGQTISQPYVVAVMTQALQLSGHETVLEIGTGSGYQTAILCRLARQVFSLERHSELAERAAEVLEELGYDNVEIHVGDGSQGLPDMAPYDAILVSAAAPSVPSPLVAQLTPDGRLVIPIGGSDGQWLERIRRRDGDWEEERLIPVMFVPLIGKYGFDEDARGPRGPWA